MQGLADESNIEQGWRDPLPPSREAGAGKPGLIK